MEETKLSWVTTWLGLGGPSVDRDCSRERTGEARSRLAWLDESEVANAPTSEEQTDAGGQGALP